MSRTSWTSVSRTRTQSVFLLPLNPVTAKSAKGKGIGRNVSGTSASPGGPTKGTTGVDLRWHEPEKFKLLLKEQKVELQEWAKTHPRKSDNGGKRKFDKSKSNSTFKKAKIASTKATATLVEAMSESHDAQMDLINVKLASLAGGSLALGVPPAGTAKVGSAVSFHPSVYGPPPVFGAIDQFAAQTEQARVAAVNFKNILKPPSKKTAP